jgi:hypothetical protein
MLYNKLKKSFQHVIIVHEITATAVKTRLKHPLFRDDKYLRSIDTRICFTEEMLIPRMRLANTKGDASSENRTKALDEIEGLVIGRKVRQYWR